MRYYEGRPAAAAVQLLLDSVQPLAASKDPFPALEDCMKQDQDPLTPRQQGIIAAVYGAVILVFYTLMGVL